MISLSVFVVATYCGHKFSPATLSSASCQLRNLASNDTTNAGRINARQTKSKKWPSTGNSRAFMNAEMTNLWTHELCFCEWRKILSLQSDAISCSCGITPQEKSIRDGLSNDIAHLGKDSWREIRDRKRAEMRTLFGEEAEKCRK